MTPAPDIVIIGGGAMGSSIGFGDVARAAGSWDTDRVSPTSFAVRPSELTIPQSLLQQADQVIE